MALQIYGNLDRTSLSRGIVQSATNLIAKPAPNMVAGDSVVVDLFLTGQDGLLDIQAYPTRRLGLGTLNARPTGGTWDLGAQTGLAYNISTAALETAIEGAVAACIVTELTSFVYKVVFDSNGAQSIPTVDATALTPSSTVNITRLVTGDASTQEEWLIRIFQNPIALIDSSWTNISGSGIRGALNLGTEGVYDLLNGNTSVSTTIELELTDANGDITTIFQVPLTISGEVIGQGVTGVAAFDTYATSSQLAAAGQRGNMIFVDAVNGDNATGTAGRADLPYLTCTAALAAASSGDLIVVRPGDYSGESALSGADGVNWKIEEGAISPSFEVTGAFTFTIDGNIGGYFVSSASSEVTIKGDIGDFVLLNVGSILHLHNCKINYDGSANTLFQLAGTSSAYIHNCKFTSTESGAEVIFFSSNWAGSFIAKNCDFVNTTVATNEATTGISYDSSVTGDVQLKDCTIITAQDGTGTAKSIDAPAAQTVYIQGTLSQTHDVDSDITLAGGASITNTNFTA